MFFGIEKLGFRLLNLHRKEALLLGTSMLAWMAMSKATLADTTVAADATLSADETGSVNFTADNTLTVNDTISITGVVDNGSGTDGTGYVDFLGSSTVGGAIGGTNSLNTLSVGVTASTVQLNGDITAAGIVFSSDGTLSLATGKTLSGTITTTTTGVGDVVFEGNYTVGGAIGAAANTLGTLSGGVTGTTVQLLGDTFAGSVELSSDGTVSLADGKTLGGTITSTTTGVGDVVFEGDATVTGQVGASANTIGTLSASTADAKNVQFDSDVYATSLTMVTDGSVTLKDGVSLTATVTATTDGTLTLAGDNTVVGDIGAAVATGVGTLSGGASTKTAQLDGDVYAVAVDIAAADGTIVLSDGKSITGAVTGTAAGQITFAGDNTVTGTITGAGTVSGGVSAKTTQLLDDVTSTTVEFASDGTIALATGKTISGTVTSLTTGVGVLNMEGDATVGGAIGTLANTVGTVASGVTATTVQLLGDVFAGVELSSDGTVSLADGKTLGGTVTSTTTGVGDVVFEGDATVTGQVGASANTIGTLSASTADAKNVQFDSDVYAVNVTLVTDGSVTLSDGISLTGAVTTATTDGNLTLAGDNTVTGDVGGATVLNTVSGGASGKTAQFNGDVYANAVDIAAADGTILLADGKSITGAVTGTAAGQITFAGDNTVTGTITGAGTVSGGVSAKTTQLLDDVTSTTVEFASDGTIALATGKTVSGTVTSLTTGVGVLDMEGNATVGGAIGTLANTVGTVASGVTATTVQLLGDVFAGVEFSSDGTVSLATGKTLGGTITSTTTGVGDVVFEGNATVTGQVGASANTIGTLSASTADATDVQFDSDVYAVNVTVVTDGSVTLSDGISVTGAVTTATTDGNLTLAGDNTITGDVGSAGTVLNSVAAGVASKTSQFDGDVYANELNLSTGTTKLTGSARTVTAAVALAAGGTLDIGTATVTQTGAITLAGATSILKTTITSTTTFGNITSGSNVDLASGVVQLDLTGATIADGATFNIVVTTGTLSNGTVTVSETSPSLSFTSSSDGTTLTLTASRDSFATAAASAPTSTAGTSTVLTSLAGTATGAMASLITAMDNLSSSTLATVMTQLTPEPSNAGAAAASSVANSVGSVIGARVAALQGHYIAALDDGEKGISTGDAQKRNGVWMQIFGSWGDQDKRKNVDGYKSETFGAAVGADTQIFDKGRLGLAFAYANTDIDGKGAFSNNNTGVDSYLVTLYGSYNMSDALYFDGSLTYGLHQYDTLRAAPAVSGRATADHDANQYSGKIGAGYNIRMGKATLTPMVSIEYLNIDEDGYTETGTGGIPLTYNSKTTDSLLLGIGARLSGDFKAGKMRYQPEIHVGGTFDALAGEVDTTAKFAQGAAFVTPGVKPADLAGNVGVGLSLFTEQDIQLTATYDAQIKDRYESHTGSLKIRVPF